MKAWWFIAICLVAATPCADAATYFVATDGDDTASGSLEAPFATLRRAQREVRPGDTVFIRGGTYKMTDADIAWRRGLWAYVIWLNKSGSPDKLIQYWAYEDEQPVFDFSEVKPAGQRVHAFEVTGSWIHLRGIEVVGVQVTIKTHTQSICFSNNGSHNIYERLSMHDGQAIGIYSVRGSDNLFLNCDAYANHDHTSEDRKGGNVDGFGCHPRKGDTGNVFRGCRAWFNSDDGFDCINAAEAVTFENCWAMYNGYSTKFASLKDGNGFKAGGYGSTPATRISKPIPRHVVRYCLAVRNRAAGFYANHHIGGGDWLYNSAYRNGADFNMLCRKLDNFTDVPGYDHKLAHNVSYKGRNALARIDQASCELTDNLFGAASGLTDADFVGFDESELVSPRQPDGSLPKIDFMRPAAGSKVEGHGYTAFVPAADEEAESTSEASSE